MEMDLAALQEQVESGRMNPRYYQRVERKGGHINFYNDSSKCSNYNVKVVLTDITRVLNDDMSVSNWLDTNDGSCKRVSKA